MFKKILTGMRKFFCGETLDEECKNFVDEYSPSTDEERILLAERFWKNKASKLGYF